MFSEMGDAVLGLVAEDMGASAPRWLAIRNVSDPQIKADGLTLKQQAAIAAQIYKGFGRWSRSAARSPAGRASRRNNNSVEWCKTEN